MSNINVKQAERPVIVVAGPHKPMTLNELHDRNPGDFYNWYRNKHMRGPWWNDDTVSSRRLFINRKVKIHTSAEIAIEIDDLPTARDIQQIDTSDLFREGRGNVAETVYMLLACNFRYGDSFLKGTEIKTSSCTAAGNAICCKNTPFGIMVSVMIDAQTKHQHQLSSVSWW